MNQNKEFFFEFDNPTNFAAISRAWALSRFCATKARRLENSYKITYRRVLFPKGKRKRYRRFYYYYNTALGLYSTKLWPSWFGFILPNFYKENKWFYFLYNLIIYSEQVLPLIENIKDWFSSVNENDNNNDNFFIENGLLCAFFEKESYLLFDRTQKIISGEQRLEINSNIYYRDNEFLLPYDNLIANILEEAQEISTAFSPKITFAENIPCDVALFKQDSSKNVLMDNMKNLENYRITYFQRIFGMQQSYNLDRDYRYIPRLQR